ncbi:MAG: PAS domain S-box protein [Bacteroidia bacterium]
MSLKTKILIAEHDSADLELLVHELTISGINFESQIVDNGKEYALALKNFVPDIILCDYTFPSFDGPEAFKIRQDFAPETPFIFVTGTLGEEVSVELIKSGVTDYVLKDKMFTLIPKIERSLKEFIIKQEKNNTYNKNQVQAELLNTIGQAVMAADLSGIINFWNKAAETTYGWSAEEAIGANVLDLVQTQQRKEQAAEMLSALYKGNSWSGELEMHRKNGTRFTALINNSPVYDSQHNLTGIIGITSDLTEIKKVEKQLKENEAFTLGILNSLDSHIAVIDESGKIVAVNESWKKFAIQNGETTLQHTGVGSNYYDVCERSAKNGDEISKEALKRLKDVMKENTSFYLEYPCHSPKIQRWFGLRAMKFDSVAPMVVVVHLDITERKLAEENSLKSEAKLKEAQAIAHISNWEIDLVTNLHTWSNEGYKILGIEKVDLQPSTDTFLSFIHPDDQAFVQGIIKKAFETLEPSSMNFRFYTSDGILKHGYMESRIEVDENNIPIRLYGIMQDVTEQKKAELILIESESRLAEAQAMAKVGNWETDLATMKVIWSAETFSIFEIDPADFPGSHPSFIEKIHPEDREAVDVAFKNSFNNNSINSIEHRIITSTGQLKIVEERWMVHFDKSGLPCHAIGTCQDITERKKTEKEREKLTNDLIQRNRDLEQFAFIISHNLRAPTANIIGFTDILQDETLTPEEQKQFLEGLAVSVSGLDTTIKDLNAILQVKKEINEKKELISFSSLVNDISVSLENITDKNHFQINSDFTEADDFFSLKAYMHSIFYNLISNSIKYCKPNEQPLIEIKSRRQNEKLELTFKDYGLGIDMKAKGAKVFGLYKRFHTHVEGKGLGLFMVKTQVEALGGKITIESKPNKGTEFTIVFEN